KTGNGTLMLAGNSTFAGSFNVAAGTLAIGGQDALPLNADVSVQSGAALNLGTFGNGNSTVASKPIHSLTVNGGLVRVPNSSGDYWLNQLALTGGTVRFDDPAALTSGPIDIGGGILQYGGAGSVAVSQKPTVFSGWIDVPNAQATANFVNGLGGNGSIEKIGAGTLALPNARQSVL